MSGPLNTIFGALNASVATGLAALSPSVVATYGTTVKERYFDSVPPRICWYADAEGYGPPVGQGGDVVVDSAGNMTVTGKPPLMTRNVTARCVIWGTNQDATESMLNVVLGTVHNLLSAGSYQNAGGQWLPPDDKTNYFDAYELSIQFLVPVPRLELASATTTAIITSIPETPQVNH